MTQDELKALVGQAALQYVVPGDMVGVGTGSTVNKFIDALATMKDQHQGRGVQLWWPATERLRGHRHPVLEAATRWRSCPVYIDGADEIDRPGPHDQGRRRGTHARKDRGRAGANVCLHCRRIQAGGRVGPLSAAGGGDPHGHAAHHAQFAALGGTPTVRLKDGKPLVTDNGQHILDVTGLRISDPLAFESDVNQWPGVVTVGVFAHQKAAVCLLGTATGVKTLTF
jgi:ribose 5-phosphate isomerase A